MDALELATRVATMQRRTAGSDAERRAALLLAEALRATSRRRRRTTQVDTIWVRPHHAPVHALCSALAVVGSALSVAHPAVGLGLVVAGLLLLAEDLAGPVRPLRRLTRERATQNVVSREARQAPVRLVVTAAIDAPSPGVLGRGRLARAQARLRRRLRGRLPGPYGLLLAALVALAGCTLARVLGGSGTALGAIQLAPTVLVLLGVAAALDRAGSTPAPAAANADASAVAVAVALVGALDAAPPRHLAVDCVLAGAGGAQALGFRHWLREERRDGRRAEEIAVLQIAACGAGRPVFYARDGLVVPLRFHPRLRALAAASGFRALESREGTAARAARGLRWPAIVVGCADDDGVVPRTAEASDTAERLDPQAMQATLDGALALVHALDAELVVSTAARPSTPSPSRLRRRAPVAQPSPEAWRERPPAAPPSAPSPPPPGSARAARRAASGSS